MNATHLFVELIVIGVGAFVSLILLVGIFYPLSPLIVPSLPVALVLYLSAIYLLGILVDRAADRLIAVDIDEQLFGSEPEKGATVRRNRNERILRRTDRFYASRRKVAVAGGALWQHLEYVRSRLRICRGWILNGALLGFSAAFYAWFREAPVVNRMATGLVAASAGVAITAACYLVWRDLAKSYREKCLRQARWLVKEESGGNDSIIEEAI